MQNYKLFYSVLFFLCIILLVHTNINAQKSPTNGNAEWFLQTSGTANTLRGVSFTDADNGTAVGQSGTILRTVDGGTNWILQTSGTTNELRGVSFTDENNGTVVGQFGTILRTTDGGADWAAQTSGIDTIWLERVSFADVNNGLVVGQMGQF